MRASASSWFLIIAGGAAVASSNPAASDGMQLDVELASARREAASADALQRQAERAAAQARDEAQKLRLQQIAAAQAIAGEEARISAADSEARLLRYRLEAQRQALASERAPVSSLLAGLALVGQRPPVAMLADHNSTRELIKVKLLVKAITPHIQEQSSALAARLDRSRALERSTLAARDRAFASRRRLEQRKVALASLETKALSLAEARGSEALGAGDLVLATHERAQMLEGRAGGRLSSESARELAALGPAPIRPGSTRLPKPPLIYRLPAAAAVTEGLGSISGNGVRSRGVTLATRRGEPIAAPAGGTILYSGPFRDYDGVVIIDHGGGWRSVLVNVGTRVPKGERVSIGQPLGVALGPIEVQLQDRGRPVSAAIIAGSSGLLSKHR